MRYLKLFCLPLLSLLLFSCGSPQSLVYQGISNFRLQDASVQEAVVAADLRFYNPNDYSLSLKNGDLDAWLNGYYLGKAQFDDRVPVPARDTFMLPISVAVKIKSIFPNALTFLANQEIAVRLQGHVKVGKGGVYIRVPVNYEGRQQVKF